MLDLKTIANQLNNNLEEMPALNNQQQQQQQQ